MEYRTEPDPLYDTRAVVVFCPNTGWNLLQGSSLEWNKKRAYISPVRQTSS
jgi:hypothetical protein